MLGSAARFTPGGKGANQAVAAARLGASVRMAGCVGDDDFGRQLLAALGEEQVDTGGVRTVTGVPTGLAMISVDPAGENLITVAPGANHEVGAGEVAAAASSPGDVLVICAEIPVPAIKTALAQASRAGARCVLNLAPAPPEAAAIVADGVDWLVVNETEAAAVLGRKVEGLTDAVEAAAGLLAAGARHAVVTAGAHGAALAPSTGPEGAPLTIEAFGVEAVNTVAGRRHLRRRARRRPGRGRPAGRGGPRGRRRGRHGRHSARRPGRDAAPRGHPRGDRPDLAGTLGVHQTFTRRSPIRFRAIGKVYKMFRGRAVACPRGDCDVTTPGLRDFVLAHRGANPPRISWRPRSPRCRRRSP